MVISILISYIRVISYHPSIKFKSKIFRDGLLDQVLKTQKLQEIDIHRMKKKNYQQISEKS